MIEREPGELPGYLSIAEHGVIGDLYTAALVGTDGPRTYLLAMLNPAEQRYSGGGALSFTTMRFDHGVATFGSSVNVDDILTRGESVRGAKDGDEDDKPMLPPREAAPERKSLLGSLFGGGKK